MRAGLRRILKLTFQEFATGEVRRISLLGTPVKNPRQRGETSIASSTRNLLRRRYFYASLPLRLNSSTRFLNATSLSASLSFSFGSVSACSMS
jgi:hypothetical protein